MLAAAERELEGEPFLAVGVHSPKFPNERDPAMVAEAGPAIRHHAPGGRRLGDAHLVPVRGGIAAVPADSGGDGRVWIADTFNHKVKVLDHSSGTVATLFGDGTPERLPEVVPGRPLRPASPGAPAFFEPEGLAWRDGELIVADTNNHRVLAVTLDGGARRVLMGG